MAGKRIKIIGGIFFAALLFLIFFSKTIYSHNLPTVTAVLPFNNKLNKRETTTGIVDWANISEIYSEVGGKVDKILVNEGDIIEEGQALIHLSFDEEDMERALRELDINKSKLALDIENIHIKLDKINYYITQLENEIYEKDDISDFELTQLENKIARLEEDYKKSAVLYEAGALPKQELETMEQEIQVLNDQYENLQKTMAEQDKKAGDSIEDKEKIRQKQLTDYQYEILALEQDLKSKNLEITNVSLQGEKYRKTLADYSRSAVIYAPSDATVISIPIKQGQYINANSLMISFGVGTEYKLLCDISLDNNFVAAGDECSMSNSSHTLEGVVTKITPLESRKQITVAVTSDEISSGETFDITFEKESSESYILVPNGAVNKDSDGYFLYQIKRRDGMMGKEYYSEKIRIYIGDSDNENTVIVRGVTFFEPVILLSDKSFSENDTLILANEGDFFAAD